MCYFIARDYSWYDRFAYLFTLARCRRTRRVLRKNECNASSKLIGTAHRTQLVHMYIFTHLARMLQRGSSALTIKTGQINVTIFVRVNSALVFILNVQLRCLATHQQSVVALRLPFFFHLPHCVGSTHH